MKQTIGGTWTLQLMIVFILLFSAYIILTINYSKTIKIKNEAVSLVEKYNGLNENSITQVNGFLNSQGYAAKGSCGSGSGIYGSTDLETKNLELAKEGEKYYYCIKKYSGNGKTNYYQVTLFYKFNLPVLGSIGSYNVKGSTGSFQSGDASSYNTTILGL